MNHTKCIRCNAEQLTIKQAFYRGVQGVFAQGKPSINSLKAAIVTSGPCVYNAPDGSHCAIGHIPKQPELLEEGNPYINRSGDIIALEIERQTGVAPNEVLEDLQNAHDKAARLPRLTDSDFITAFMERCAQIAEDHGLTYIGDE